MDGMSQGAPPSSESLPESITESDPVASLPSSSSSASPLPTGFPTDPSAPPADQQAEIRQAQRTAQEQQAYQQHRARLDAEAQQLVQQVTNAKIQARQTQAEFRGSSAVMQTTNRQGDRSELSLMERIHQDAVSRQQREANFKNMLQAPKGQQKGPQGEGEGGGGRGSMVDRMTSGNERPQFDQQKADSEQKRAEKSVGE